MNAPVAVAMFMAEHSEARNVEMSVLAKDTLTFKSTYRTERKCFLISTEKILKS